jgi:hypothetical protein
MSRQHEQPLAIVLNADSPGEKLLFSYLRAVTLI